VVVCIFLLYCKVTFSLCISVLFRFQELVDSLPQSVKMSRYCLDRLERLEAMSSYIYHFTDAMSKAKLLEVLETLHVWELTAPDVEPAIRVCHRKCFSESTECIFVMGMPFSSQYRYPVSVTGYVIMAHFTQMLIFKVLEVSTH